MMTEIPSLSVSDFMIISGYTEQVDAYKAIIRDNPEWIELKIRTVNKVQGHENPIVVFDGVSGANMNGKVGFYDKHRVAVIPTQKTSLKHRFDGHYRPQQLHLPHRRSLLA